MKTFKNVEIVGYTLKNLSAIIRIGFADFGDYRSGTLYAISREGDIYRPIVFNETFFTQETLPESAKWVLSKEIEFSEKTKNIINKINSQFTTQSGCLDLAYRTQFKYDTLITGLSAHHITFEYPFTRDYYAMLKALEYHAEIQRLKKELEETKKRSSKNLDMYLQLVDAVFSRFFVGKLCKRQYNVNAQKKRFIEQLTK